MQCVPPVVKNPSEKCWAHRIPCVGGVWLDNQNPGRREASHGHTLSLSGSNSSVDQGDCGVSGRWVASRPGSAWSASHIAEADLQRDLVSDAYGLPVEGDAGDRGAGQREHGTRVVQAVDGGWGVRVVAPRAGGILRGGRPGAAASAWDRLYPGADAAGMRGQQAQSSRPWEGGYEGVGGGGGGRGGCAAGGAGGWGEHPGVQAVR